MLLQCSSVNIFVGSQGGAPPNTEHHKANLGFKSKPRLNFLSVISACNISVHTVMLRGRGSDTSNILLSIPINVPYILFITMRNFAFSPIPLSVVNSCTSSCDYEEIATQNHPKPKYCSTSHFYSLQIHIVSPRVINEYLRFFNFYFVCLCMFVTVTIQILQLKCGCLKKTLSS